MKKWDVPSGTYQALVFCTQMEGSTPQLLLFPALDVHFFYTRSHLSALQNCALFYQPIFSLFSHLKNVLHNLVIELCSALKYVKYI